MFKLSVLFVSLFAVNAPALSHPASDSVCVINAANIISKVDQATDYLERRTVDKVFDKMAISINDELDTLKSRCGDDIFAEVFSTDSMNKLIIATVEEAELIDRISVSTTDTIIV